MIFLQVKKADFPNIKAFNSNCKLLSVKGTINTPIDDNSVKPLAWVQSTVNIKFCGEFDLDRYPTAVNIDIITLKGRC